MKTLNLTDFTVEELSMTDCSLIEGGSEIDKNSTAYKIGHFIGEAAIVVSSVTGLGGAFKKLKSFF